MKETKRTNADGTCLWCGRRLGWACDTKTERADLKWPKCPTHGELREKLVFVMRQSGEDRHYCPRIVGDYGLKCGESLVMTKRRVVSRVRRHEKPGLRGEGHFCTGACSAAFGRAAARNGYRFKPEE